MREAGMSVLTTGKPNGLTRASAPARQRAGAVGRGQAAGASRPVRRRQVRPGPGAVRHLRVVPDAGLPEEAQAGPQNGRRGASAGPASDAPTRRGAPAVPDTRRAPRRSTVRLTRRGRIVVAVMLTAASLSLVVLAWLAIAARAAQAADGGQRPGAVYQNLTSVVVHPGQTLWSIASQAEPTADPRAVMQQIIDLNGLRGTSLEPGQRLWVPRG